MNFPEFEAAIDRLVTTWATDAETELAAGRIPREQLQVIYDQVRNDTAFELAQCQRNLDLAMEKLHKKYLKGEIRQ